MGDKAFGFSPPLAADAIARFKGASDGQIRLLGDDWAQGAMGALFNAEYLAAQAGVVPFFTLPDGSKGVLNIGGARAHIDKAPEAVRTIYLASHGVVRATHAQAHAASPNTPHLASGPLGELSEAEIGAVPLAVYVVAVAVAAIVAGAWYLKTKTEIEVEGKNLRTTATISEINALATAQLATTGKIDPALYDALKSMAGAEEAHLSWVPYAVGAGAVVAAAGGLWIWKRAR